MIPIYIGAAFVVGLITGALLGRSRVVVKLGTVEVHGASAQEVSGLLRTLRDYAKPLQEGK